MYFLHPGLLCQVGRQVTYNLIQSEVNAVSVPTKAASWCAAIHIVKDPYFDFCRKQSSLKICVSRELNFLAKILLVFNRAN